MGKIDDYIEARKEYLAAVARLRRSLNEALYRVYRRDVEEEGDHEEETRP